MNEFKKGGGKVTLLAEKKGKKTKCEENGGRGEVESVTFSAESLSEGIKFKNNLLFEKRIN